MLFRRFKPIFYRPSRPGLEAHAKGVAAVHAKHGTIVVRPCHEKPAHWPSLPFALEWEIINYNKKASFNYTFVHHDSTGFSILLLNVLV